MAFATQLEDGWLTARLPSGRKLWYYDPQAAVRKAMPWRPRRIPTSALGSPTAHGRPANGSVSLPTADS
jgi:hypothetical protein